MQKESYYSAKRAEMKGLTRDLKSENDWLGLLDEILVERKTHAEENKSKKQLCSRLTPVQKLSQDFKAGREFERRTEREGAYIRAAARLISDPTFTSSLILLKISPLEEQKLVVVAMNCTGLNSTLRGNLTDCNGSLTRTPRNPSLDTYSHEKVMAILLPFAILIVLINGVVVLLFYKTKKLRTPGNYVLLSLAVSDFISGSFNIPIYITFCVQKDAVLLHIFEVLCKMTAILTAYHIVAVTAEKYIAIVKPFQHRSANPKTSFIIVGLIWIASTVIAVLPVIWTSHLSQDPRRRKIGLYLHLGHDVFCFIAVFLIPYLFIVYAQIVMFRTISSRTETFKEETRTSKSTRRRKTCAAQERKCIAVFATMAVLFAICWLPWFILSFCATMTAVNTKLLPIMLKLSPLLEAFAVVRFSTCIINPFLYTFFKRDFLEALKTTCRCKFDGERESQSFNYELKKSFVTN